MEYGYGHGRDATRLREVLTALRVRMRFLLLGGAAELLLPGLAGNNTTFTESPLSLSEIAELQPDWLLSFGYRHIVPREVLSQLQGRAINLHISMLPWNRGADPNLWSWLEDTPKGVTIHWMTEGLDRGDIIQQREVDLDDSLTLRESYEVLIDEVVVLFGAVATHFVSGDVPRKRQPDGGSYHRSADKDEHFSRLPHGWDTPCRIVREYGAQRGLAITDHQ